MGFQGVGNAGNLIPLSRWPYLGEFHFSLSPSTYVLCAILESKDCFCLWHFLNVWLWGHRYSMRPYLSKSWDSMVTTVQEMGMAHIIYPPTVMWLGETSMAPMTHAQLSLESIGWKNELGSAQRKSSIKPREPPFPSGAPFLELFSTVTSRKQWPPPPSSCQLVGSEAMRKHWLLSLQGPTHCSAGSSGVTLHELSFELCQEPLLIFKASKEVRKWLVCSCSG